MPNSINPKSSEKQKNSTAGQTRSCTAVLGAASLAVSLSLVLNVSLPVQRAQAAPSKLLENPLVSSETKNKLLQIEKRRKELHERAALVRQKEQLAMIKLSSITKKLNTATGQLVDSKHQLKRTENKLNETVQVLTVTQTKEENLSAGAAKRLREIYEGQRLSFLEMLFQMDSLQAFLDNMYFQERVAEEDRKLLNELRARTAALNSRKGLLADQKDKIGSLVSEFARKALEIAKARFEQEQVASKLKTQRAFYEQAEQQLSSESHRLESQILAMQRSARSSNKSAQQGSGNLSMPLKASITSPFGWRRHPIFGVRKFHTGIDLAGPNRSPIRAADSGSVLFTGWYGGYGKVVIISHGNSHGDDMATLYAHLSRAGVSVGDNVNKGDVIGYEGTTGFSTGPHLHFEVRVNGKPNNPLNYLR